MLSEFYGGGGGDGGDADHDWDDGSFKDQGEPSGGADPSTDGDGDPN